MVKQVRCLHVTSIFSNKIATASTATIIYSLSLSNSLLTFSIRISLAKSFQNLAKNSAAINSVCKNRVTYVLIGNLCLFVLSNIFSRVSDLVT